VNVLHFSGVVTAAVVVFIAVGCWLVRDDGEDLNGPGSEGES
jgi:hypothetical protein